MVILFLLGLVEPVAVISLDRQFNQIVYYHDQIYLAPFTGTSIFTLDSLHDLIPISFTDDLNYRIYDFQITPFAIFLNSGQTLEKFYLSSGIKEIVYTSAEIISFALMSSEDIILADRQNRELVFLDFTSQVKFTKQDIEVKDLQTVNNRIYVLTKNSLLIFDEYGNVIEEKKLPEKLARIFVDSSTIFLYSFGKKYFYRCDDGDDAWHKTELTYPISNISGNNYLMAVIDGRGTNIYLYNKSEF